MMSTKRRPGQTVHPLAERPERPPVKKVEFDPPDPNGPKQGDFIYVWTGAERPQGADAVRIIFAVVTKVLHQGRVQASGITSDTIMRVFDDCAPEGDDSPRARNAPFRWAPSPYMEMRVWFEKYRAPLEQLLNSQVLGTTPVEA